MAHVSIVRKILAILSLIALLGCDSKEDKSIKFAPDKLESAHYMPEGMPVAPIVAVFEKGEKTLVYIAEEHSTVESFDLINRSFDFENSGLPRPDTMLIEFESSGRVLHMDLSDQYFKSRMAEYENILNKSKDNSVMLPIEKQINTIEYAGAVAKGNGIDVVLIDMSETEMLNVLQSEYGHQFTGTELDIVLHSTTGKRARPGEEATEHDMFLFLMKKRDEYMVSKIADALNGNNTVWCILGAGHFYAEYPVLVEALGKPKFISYGDFETRENSF